MKLPRAFWTKHATLVAKCRYWERKLRSGRHDAYALEKWLLLSSELEALKEEAQEASRARAAAAASKEVAPEWKPITTLTFD